MTAQPAAAASSATRPWRIRGYTGTLKKDQKLVVDKVCRGDAELDREYGRLEDRRDVARITVEQQW